MSASPAGEERRDGQEHSVQVSLEGFAWEALERESERSGVPVQELVAFAVLYYLADLDSGRISRQVMRSPHLDPSMFYPDAST
jgi:hypothetical protein